jgi:tripartite-type tricarboxylate transporter receptor subunit TctC
LSTPRAGRLRALAVTTSTRWEGLPGIPTVGEFVPGYDGSGWYGIGAPDSGSHVSMVAVSIGESTRTPSG